METSLQVPSALWSTFYLSIYGALIELGKAPFVASWMVLPKSGTVKNLFCSILSETLVENWATCFHIYRSNASLFHLPMITIVSGVTPARYIAISSPERRECDPISIGPKPNIPLPMIWTATPNFLEFLWKLWQTFFLSYLQNGWPEFFYVGWCLGMIKIVSQFFPLEDWSETLVIWSVHSDILITIVVILIFKSNIDPFCVVNVLIML